MLTDNELIGKLQTLAKDKFHTVDLETVSSLIPNMLHHIGSADSQLRDDLIYSAFLTWIHFDKIISEEQLRSIKQVALDDQHLFYKIGEENTDSVFQRSFSVLLLPLILIRHRNQPFLSKIEIDGIRDQLLRYCKEENDRRGYVDGKGWAHAIAHSADALDDLAQCSELNVEDLKKILELIRSIICIDNFTYTYGEEERLATAAIAVIRRNELSNDYLSLWIRSFADAAAVVTQFPEKLTIRANIKNFLQSLYFRLQWAIEENTINPQITEVLYKMNPYVDHSE